MNQKKNKPKLSQLNRQTKASREFTAGGVVYRLRNNGVEVLMIQDQKGRWTIPKGHVERGESLEQTALREVREETGLRKIKIRHKLDKIHCFYRLQGKLIFMTTYVFLMEALGDSDHLVPENNEGIVDVRWFPQEQALQLIEYKQTEQLMRLGLDKLEVMAR